MESRMEKYKQFDIEDFQRCKKNATLYKEVYGNYGDFEDLPVSDNTNEIDIENLKSLVGSRVSRRKEQLEEIDVEDESIVMPEEDKIYDINALLEKAKEENAKIKKETPINKSVPNYLASLESDKNTKELILKHDNEDDEDLPIVNEIKYSTSEFSIDGKRVNTSMLSLDILSDLKPTGKITVSETIKEEINEEEEKAFYSGKLEFSKADFESNESEEDEDFYIESNHTIIKIFLVMIGLSSIFVAAYFILKEYTNIF